MAYENHIPDYALQPAKAPELIEADAVYHREKIICPEEGQSVSYEFEEDILVPDSKPDMKEILFMDADAEIQPAQKKLLPKTEDLLNITGTITLQTLYSGEDDEENPVAITSEIPYKYQWTLNPEKETEGVFHVRVKALDYTIVNERKFRVKFTLEFTGKFFSEKEFAFFTGLKGDSLETKKKPLVLYGLGLAKEDEISIDETFSVKDSLRPEYILKQNFAITENYRQVTGEKVVINGFIFCSLLYSGEELSGEEPRQIVRQHNERLEFTQFLPLEKEQQMIWSEVRTEFRGKNLQVSIEEGEDEGRVFRLHGDIAVRAELYEQRSVEMIVDAYHREKDFVCDFETENAAALSDAGTAEISLREIVSLPEGQKAEEPMYCTGRIVEYLCTPEKGRVLVEGSAELYAFLRTSGGHVRRECVPVKFKTIVALERADEGQKVFCRPLFKTAWVDLINEKQIEVNGALSVYAETMQSNEITLLVNPKFLQKAKKREYPMAIVRTKKGESLWELAKRYRTTEEQIIACNHLQGEPEEGRKLLIIR